MGFWNWRRFWRCEFAYFLGKRNLPAWIWHKCGGKAFVKMTKNNWNIKEIAIFFEIKVSVIYCYKQTKTQVRKSGKMLWLADVSASGRTLVFPCYRKVLLSWKLRFVNKKILDFELFLWYYIKVIIGWTRLTACLSAERLCFLKGFFRKQQSSFADFPFIRNCFETFLSRFVRCARS